MKNTFSIRHATAVALIFVSVLCRAQIPANYKAAYAALEGKQGEADILSALYSLISSHTDVGYDGLYSVYPTSDLQGSNGVWDIYSTCSFTHGSKKCGTYQKVCDCYNREHSVPQSWFGEAKPMKSDAFHVYPTDGKVNGQRGNWPYGECSGGTSLGGKALGRLGTSTFTGYTNVGTVFEPDNQYKGDLARTYFYMVACYYNKNFTKAAEGKKVFTYSNSKTGLTAYAKALFTKWDAQDPVSQKEKDRQEAVYAKQHNRNPFIDCPVLAQYIWGGKAGQAVSRADLAACGCIDDGSAVEEVMSPALAAFREDGGVLLIGMPEKALVYVFTASGTLSRTEQTCGTECHLTLPAGFYLLVVTDGHASQAIKVAVN